MPWAASEGALARASLVVWPRLGTGAGKVGAFANTVIDGQSSVVVVGDTAARGSNKSESSRWSTDISISLYDKGSITNGNFLGHSEDKGKAAISITSTSTEQGTAKVGTTDQVDRGIDLCQTLIGNLNDKVGKVGIVNTCCQLADSVSEDRSASNHAMRISNIPSVDREKSFSHRADTGINI